MNLAGSPESVERSERKERSNLTRCTAVGLDKKSERSSGLTGLIAQARATAENIRSSEDISAIEPAGFSANLPSARPFGRQAMNHFLGRRSKPI